MAFPPTFDRAFDETFPPDTQLANLLGQDIRNLKTDIRERFALLSGTLANRPTNMDAAFGGAGYGTLYFATDTGQIFQWNGAAWVDISGTLFSGIVARVNLTGQAAAILPTVIYTVPVGGSGVYRFIQNSIITVVGTGGNIVPQAQWNNGVAAQGPTFLDGGLNPTILGADTANVFGGLLMYVPAGQSIKYQVDFNAVTGAPQYSFRARLEYLG